MVDETTLHIWHGRKNNEHSRKVLSRFELDIQSLHELLNVFENPAQHVHTIFIIYQALRVALGRCRLQVKNQIRCLISTRDLAGSGSTSSSIGSGDKNLHCKEATCRTKSQSKDSRHKKNRFTNDLSCL